MRVISGVEDAMSTLGAWRRVAISYGGTTGIALTTGTDITKLTVEQARFLIKELRMAVKCEAGKKITP